MAVLPGSASASWREATFQSQNDWAWSYTCMNSAIYAFITSIIRHVGGSRNVALTMSPLYYRGRMPLESPVDNICVIIWGLSC